MQRAHDPRDSADALCGIAMSLRGMCRYRGAIAAFEKALEIYTELSDRDGIAFALYGMGGAYRFIGEFKRALPMLTTSLKLADDPESIMFTLMARGGLYRMIGRYRASLADYQKARRMAGRMRHAYAMAYSDCGIGNAFRMLGKHVEARRKLKAAEKRYLAIGDVVSRPYTLFALALMDMAEGRKADIESPKRLFARTGDKRGLVYAHLLKAVHDGPEKSKVRKAIDRIKKDADALELKFESLHASLLSEKPGVAVRRYQQLGCKPITNVYLIP